MKTLHHWMMPVLACGMALSVSGCMYRTGPTEVGVRTVKWSIFGEKGVEDKAYEPGTTHFYLPFLAEWHSFDTRLQNLEMTEIKERGDRVGPDELRFKTIDGNDIGLDVIISYRIMPEKAPTILQEVAGSDLELRESIVRTITRSKPRDIFGELNTEEFYISEERTAKADRVAEELNTILEGYGVVIERVGTGDYRFNPEYQQAIEDKKVADQEVEKLKAETRATEAEYLTKVEEAKAEIERIRAEANGGYERAVIEADAYYGQQEQIAEAILAEAQAEAEAIEKMNLALSGSGGDAMVKLKVAEALANKRIIMLPMGGGGLDVRSTDINQLLQLFGIKGVAGGAKP